MLVVVLNFCAIPLHAQLPYSETFKNSTASNVLISGKIGDAFLTSGSIDPVGSGYLRLTNNQNNQSGFIRSTYAFPSKNGLSISFEYFTFGGTGADGITFFLYDSSVDTFSIGAFGGSLGYAQNADLAGLSKGFLALGLDEFGNFSNPNAGRQGGPGRSPSSVLLRGDGNGLGSGTPSGSNYEYLKGISTNNTTEMALAGAGGIFHVAGRVDGRTILTGLSPLNTGYRKAKIDLIPNEVGTGFIINVWITEGNVAGAIVHHVIKDYLYIPTGAIPANLSYGFSASTGGESNFHEIRNLEILKPLDPTATPSIANVSVEGLENVELTFKSSDFSSKFSQKQSHSLVKIKIQNLPKFGILKLNETLVTVGQEINLNDISQLKFIPESDFSGTTSFQWNGSDANTYAGSDAFVNLNIIGFNPTFPYQESFMKANASGLIKRGSPNAAVLTSGSKDPIDAGYLRLTNNQTNQSAYAYSTKDFPTDKGLSISFDYYMHGGSGSEGISFYLYDAAANPFSIGVFGGGLGYTQRDDTSNGLNKGFIGLGIDEYGNFSNPGAGRQGGPGRFPGSITLRGDGDGNLLLPSNYEYLTHTQTNNVADMLAVAGGSAFPLSGNTDGRSSGNSGLDSLKTGYRRLKLDLVPNESGTGFLINAWITEGNPAGAIVHQVIKNKNYIPTDGIPANLRYGFSASNGTATTSYEIRNLKILLPSNEDHKPVLKSIELSGNEDQEMVFKLSDFTNNFFDPKGLNTLKKVEFTSLPLSAEGNLKLDGVDIVAGMTIQVSEISSGKLRFFPASNFNGKLKAFQWNGYTGTIKAKHSEDIFITVNPVNDSPLSEDVEILIGSTERILAASNFKFTDPNDNNFHAFKAIKITSTPGLGTLKLDNTIIVAGQLIDIEVIRSGKLSFTPVYHESGKPYTAFTFRVQDNGGNDNGGDDLSQIYEFKINIAPIPLIELEQTNRSVCIGSSSVDFNYSSLSGDPLPNIYNIDWDNAANLAGLIDIKDKDLLAGTISIENISNLTVGIYNGFLTVRNKNNDILSLAKSISITVKPLLRADISYGGGVFFARGKIMATVSGDTSGRFGSSPGLIINELTGEINLKESTPGNYWVSYSLSNDACTLTATAPLIVKPMPVISTITGSNSVIAGSSIQLNSATAGGTWHSSDTEVLRVNSEGLASGLKKGEVQVFYTVQIEDYIDSVSFKINVSQAKASDLSKISNPIKRIAFSASEFYSLIDSVSKVNDPSGTVMTKIKIESLPSNGELKFNGKPVVLAQEFIFEDISGLTYNPHNDFSGTDIFSWNWADVSGKFGDLVADVTIVIIPNSTLIQKMINENEVFAGKTSTSGRQNFKISGIDTAGIEINSLNGEFTMKSRDFESPEDANFDNVYEFSIRSIDNNDNSYTENWSVAVQNVRELSYLSFKEVQDITINENLKYTSTLPILIGTPIGKFSYALVGEDASLFKLDTLTGIVSMEAKDFEFPTDSDKDNVYEIRLKITDSDLNTAALNWKIRIVDVQKVAAFKIATIGDVQIDEKTIYTSKALVLYGEPVGKITYSLYGMDSGLFTLNESNGIVSMSARDFDFPMDSNRDNSYEVRLMVKDSDGNKDSLEWKISIQRIPPSSAQSVLSPDSISVPLDKDNPQLLTLITKYPNGDNYLKGGELVVFSKVSGSAIIGEPTDHGNGIYTALVYPGSEVGRNVFVATLGGREIMNGSDVQAKVIIDFLAFGDNRLKDLKLSSGNLSPQFKSDIFNYSASVRNFIDSIALSSALYDQNAEIKINGIVHSIKDSQFKIPLKIGENLISILITAEDGVSKQVYTVNINRFASSLPYRESFMNNTGEGLVFGGFPDQVSLTSGSIDEQGKGYLRLTNNKLNEIGFVHNSQKFSSAKGLSISFEYYSHGGTGGNGLSFYLFDASANFNPGAFGGSLGYAQNAISAGLSKGFIGLGLDELGEFSSTSSGKQGGPGRRPSSVVLRGDGDGRTANSGSNYEYLSGLQTTDAALMKIVGAGDKFFVFGNQDGRSFEKGLNGMESEAYRKAKIVLVPMNNKPGFIVNVWITEGTKTGGIVHHIIKNYSYMPTDGIPLDLKYGFSASTGNLTNIYEIRNLEINIPDSLESPGLTPENGEEPIEIPVENSIIPLPTNLITPNGDGINDTWIVRNINDFSRNTVRIFSRSGQEVYRKDNYNNDWDGRTNGYLLPKGTYYYIIETGSNIPPFKGYITIL